MERKEGLKAPTHEEMELAGSLLQNHQKMQAVRNRYEAMWDELTEYVSASTGLMTSTDVRLTPGKTSNRRLNAAPGIAARMLSARVVAEMTGPGTRWFDVRDRTPDVDKIDSVRRSLQNLTDRAFSILNGDSFQMAHTECTMDWVVYGTACMQVSKDKNNKLYFKSIPVQQIWIDENVRGDVDVVYRKFAMTYRQLVQEFGEDVLPDKFCEEADKDPTKEWDVLHCVMPNADYDYTKKAAKSYKFKSCYVLMKEKVLLREAFFKHQPYIVFRFWKKSGEVYGGSPAVDALPDIRLLNALVADYLRASQLNSSPPMAAAHDSVVAPIKIVPNGINYGAINADGKKLLGPLFDQPRGEASLREVIETTIQHIRSAFFVDPLINRENSIRTAAEVTKRSSEEMVGITPFLSRYKIEYLTPVIGHVISHIINFAKEFEFPPEYNGRIPELDFSGPLAKTQRGQELNNLVQFGQLLQMFGQIDPKVLQNVDMNAYLRTVANLLSTPLDVIVPEEHMRLIQAQQAAAAEEQAQQQQMAMVMQGLQGAGQAAADFSKAGLMGREDLGLPQLNPGLGPQG